MSGRFNLDKTEIRLLVFFLLIFTIFIHWGGVNAWSRYDLTKAIVEDHSVEISPYSHNTFDKAGATGGLGFEGLEDTPYLNSTNLTSRQEEYEKAYIKGFQTLVIDVYSDKAPAPSFLAVPGYVLGDTIGSLGLDRNLWIDKPIADLPVRLSFETFIEQFLMVFTVSVLSGAVLLLMLYRHLQVYVDRKTSLYTVLIAGLATPIITYSTSFFAVITASFFGFASYLLVRKYLEEERRKWLYAAGLLSALAFSTEYYAALIPAALGFYLVLDQRYVSVLRFSAGMFIGAIPLLLYNWYITGNPFMIVLADSGFAVPGPLNVVCEVFPNCHSSTRILGFIPDPLRTVNAMVRLLFFETRGLFFYSPVLLLSIPGIYELYRRDRKLLVLFPGVFVSLLLFQAARLNWLAGVSFGPRYAIVGLPFLLLPVALGLKRVMDRGRIMRSFVFLVFLISAFNMLLGFNTLKNIDWDVGTYEERFNSFSAVQPDFYEHQLNEFGNYGARSEVLMSFTGRHKGFDVTYGRPYVDGLFRRLKFWEFDFLISLKFIPIILAIVLFIGFMWWELNYWHLLTGILLVSVLASLSVVSPSENPIFNGWYQEDPEDNAKWSKNNPEIYFSSMNTDRKILELEMRSIDKLREVNITVEDQKFRRFVRPERDIYWVSFAPEKGLNKVDIDVEGDCRPIGQIIDNDDTRCVKLGLYNYSIYNVGEKKMYRWYRKDRDEDLRWSKNDPKMYFDFQDTTGKILELDMRAIDASREVNITVGDKKMQWIVKPVRDVYWVFFKPNLGLNTVKFEVEGSCIPIGQVIENNDTRCAELGLYNHSVYSPAEKNLYTPGISDPESIRIEDRLAVMVKSSGNYSLSFNARAVSGSSILEIEKNGNHLTSTTIERFPTEFSTPYFETEDFTRLEIISKCESCNYVRISNFTIQSFRNQSENILYRPGENWYRKIESEDYRWSKGNSSIYIYNYGNELINRTLWIEGKSFNSSRDFTYFLNSEKIGRKEVFPTDFRIAYRTPEGGIHVPENYPVENPPGLEIHVDNKYGFNVVLEPGENILEIKSATECTSFGDVNNNNDVRCGLFGLKKLSVGGENESFSVE